VPDDETISCLMRSMPPNYKTFISPLRRQLHQTLQSLITNLIQRETLMKDMNLDNESSSTFYASKRYSKYNNNKFTKYIKKIPPRNVATIPSESFGKKKVKCFYCKKLGHLIKDCNKRIVKEVIIMIKHCYKK
jgi:hypothetical protein